MSEIERIRKKARYLNRNSESVIRKLREIKIEQRKIYELSHL